MSRRAAPGKGAGVLLLRLTTDYVESEDRIRLSGETGPNATQVLWLTRRLLDRLLPPLLAWLEKEAADTPRADVLQSFAQQAARAQLEAQAPVRAAADSPGWLVTQVALTPADEAMRLVFNSGDGACATLMMAAKPLRQWLGIVRDQYVKAGWPLHVWPAWMTPDAPAAGRPGALLH